LAEPGLFGIYTVDHPNSNSCAIGDLGAIGILLRRRRRIPLLARRFLVLSRGRRRRCETGIVAFGRESLATAELKVGYFTNVEGVYAVAHSHPDLASVAAEVLAVHHPAAAERE
jgi:hypothetical protein